MKMQICAILIVFQFSVNEVELNLRNLIQMQIKIKNQVIRII